MSQPYRQQCSAADFDTWRTAALAELYAAMLCPAMLPAIDEMLTIEQGSPDFTIAGMPCFMPRNPPSRSLEWTVRPFSMLTSEIGRALCGVRACQSVSSSVVAG